MAVRVRRSGMALYRAKNEGRNRACIYDAAMDADLSTRKLLEADLRDAIDSDQLQLLYQPVVNKSGDTVVGVEALCRWKHPTRGEIPPTEFIAIAEHSGLIIDLGNWVLRRACIDGRACKRYSVGQVVYSSALTSTFVPAFTFPRAFTSLSALAKILHGLASLVSLPWLIGVRPKPSAIAGPSGQ